MLRWVLLLATIIVIIIYLVQIYSHDTLPGQSGSVETKLPLQSYGFGETKRLLTFDLTEIGSVENIDLSDKKFATLTVSDSSGNKTYTIGIEVKGSGINERRKLNLAFEFWEPAEDDIPCTSIETCDDDKEELFDFGEKYEDWVLRGGYNEQTLTRDAAAPSLVGGILQSRLVEVIFKFGNKYTYEGVYLLIPAIQRRVLEKRLDWDSGGKKEDCDDEDYNINTVSLIIEHTIKSRVYNRKLPCELFKQYSVKMRYPKCEFYDEEGVASCRDEYINRTNFYASVLTWKNTSEVPLDLHSFVNTYYAEMLMREDDFPFTSQYFYVNPDNDKVYSGPRWDYDRIYWRVAATSGWELLNLGYYVGRQPMEIWQELGKNNAFIKLVKEQNATILQNKQIFLNLIDTRLQQFNNNYFDREIERWGLYGKKRPAYLDIIELNSHMTSRQKNSFVEELAAMRKQVKQRSDWMQAHINDFNGFGVEDNLQYISFILNLLPLIILVFITIAYWIYYAIDKKDFDYLIPRVTNRRYKLIDVQERMDL